MLPTIGKSLRGLEALAECVAVTWEYTAAGEGSSDEGKSSECCFSGGPGFTGAWFAALVGGGAVSWWAGLGNERRYSWESASSELASVS